MNEEALAERWHGVEKPASDMGRILALPVLDAAWQAPDLTEQMKRPGGLMRLRPIQSKALYYAACYRGLLAPIGVGHGKTLLSVLLPVILGAVRPLLLIPPSMRADLQTQWAIYSNHWLLPRNLTIQTYEFLSSPRATGLLVQLNPDVIICDEIHKLRDKTAVRTRRFLRYLKINPGVVLCGLSGTLTTRSIKDYAHLAEHSLKGNSPLPGRFGELEQWSKALDVNRNSAPNYNAQRALMPLVRRFVGNVDPDNLDGSEVREAYQRRLVSCPGIVATSDQSTDAGITITEMNLDVPESVKGWLRHLDKTWQTPDNEELEDSLAFIRVARQLSQGFFYRWVWGPSGPDKDWLEARANWHRSLRGWLPHSGTGLDSPFLTSVAAERVDPQLPGEVVSAWQLWKGQKDKPQPPTETVWLDSFMVDSAISFARNSTEPLLIWYDSEAVGFEIARKGGFPFVPGGDENNAYLAAFSNGKKPETCVLSIDAHSFGKNLQAYRKNLVTAPPSNGATWEQLLARTHRLGQEADLIECAVFSHTAHFRTAIVNARKDAEYIEATMNNPQKLCFAHWQ